MGAMQRALIAGGRALVATMDRDVEPLTRADERPLRDRLVAIDRAGAMHVARLVGGWAMLGLRLARVGLDERIAGAWRDEIATPPSAPTRAGRGAAATAFGTVERCGAATSPDVVPDRDRSVGRHPPGDDVHVGDGSVAAAAHSKTAATTVAPTQSDRLLALVMADEGCGDASERHLACRAISVEAAAGCSSSLLAALEETVLQPGRPACVQRAALLRLAACDDENDRAALALERMVSVLRRRAEWQGGVGSAALSAFAADCRAGHGTSRLESRRT